MKALDPFRRPVFEPLTPFPPTNQWRPISEKELRQAFLLSASTVIDTLPQLKGKGKPRRLDKGWVIEGFADKLLRSVIGHNIVMAHGRFSTKSTGVLHAHTPDCYGLLRHGDAAFPEILNFAGCRASGWGASMCTYDKANFGQDKAFTPQQKRDSC